MAGFVSEAIEVVKVRQAVLAYNERLGYQDELLWQRRPVALQALADHRATGVREFIWLVKEWGNINHAPDDWIPGMAAALVEIADDLLAFEAEGADYGMPGTSIDLAKRFLAAQKAGGSGLNASEQRSWSSKVLHWIAPQHFVITDSIVVGQMKKRKWNLGSDNLDGYARLTKATYVLAQGLVDGDLEFLGGTLPRTPLRALDKYWWSMGPVSKAKAAT